MPCRQEWTLVAQVPLAHAGGLVANVPQCLGQGDLIRAETLAVAGKKHPLPFLTLIEANAPGIAPGHQRTARWRTDRRGHVEAGQLAPFLCHLVQMGRSVQLRAEGSDVGVAEVIDENQDEIRFVCGSSNGRKAQQECEKESGHRNSRQMDRSLLEAD